MYHGQDWFSDHIPQWTKQDIGQKLVLARKSINRNNLALSPLREEFFAQSSQQAEDRAILALDAGINAGEMNVQVGDMSKSSSLDETGNQYATREWAMTAADTHILESDESNNTNRLMQILLIAAIAASGLSMVFSIGTAVASASDHSVANVRADQ